MVDTFGCLVYRIIFPFLLRGGFSKGELVLEAVVEKGDALGGCRWCCTELPYLMVN